MNCQIIIWFYNELPFFIIWFYYELPSFFGCSSKEWVLSVSDANLRMVRLEFSHTATHGNTRQHTATNCNTRQHTATNCNTLQHTATHCNKLQHTATHRNTLQHTATHCNKLQHIATHCCACHAQGKQKLSHHNKWSYFWIYIYVSSYITKQNEAMGWLWWVGSLKW